ncbi:hypothetical protein RK574_00110, partial [Streptococcus pneumoniae]|nr:hypothetical protein [Streptococcus pneumoniae]MDS4632410.1 hypothetical protein [Streptococcus pneumoniae]MDS4782651.1 hypothetical protein [Streptococcus pneumoniae]MDS5078494.1 hypothetical protein [Streptococcus pneumoniae]MDS8788439.1 hypothetical protein [Streptococcus pneumoniae]
MKKSLLFLILKLLSEQFCWHQQNWPPSDLILFVDLNKSIFRQTIYFATDIDVGRLDIFLFRSKQKNRKPEPAVKEQFRKFPFYLFNC